MLGFERKAPNRRHRASKKLRGLPRCFVDFILSSSFFAFISLRAKGRAGRLYMTIITYCGIFIKHFINRHTKIYNLPGIRRCGPIDKRRGRVYNLSQS